MAEKHTERITQNYITKLLNISEYNTNGNKELFNNKIPDGWLLKDDNLLIIENKPNEKQLSEGLKQLATYYKIVIRNNKEKYNIYCILSIGTTEEDHKLYYYKYVKEKDVLKKQNESQIKEIFTNSSSSGMLQTIHNNIVNNFKTSDPKDLHDILIIIIISILDENFKKYYELKEDMISNEFLDKLIELTEKKLNDANNNYKRVEEYIKNSSFINSFKICKKIYKEYNKNPKFINLLFQQFKKYSTYIGGNNEIWTPKEISQLMFNIAQKYVKKKDNITILDPCIGLNSLIYPFIDYFGGDNIIVKGCDISDRLSLIGKLDLIIHGVNGKGYIYNDDFITVEKDLTADICVCNPPYTKNITNGYECLDFVIKSLEYSKYAVFIFPKNKLIKNKKLNETLLNSYKIIEIIELGCHVFKNVETGDIIIGVFSRITDKNKDSLTKYYNLKAFSEEYKRIPHKSENILSDKGKQLINDYINGKLIYEEYEPSVNNMFPSNLLDVDNIKCKLIDEINKYNMMISSSLALNDCDVNNIINNLNNRLSIIRSCENIKDLLKSTYKNDNKHELEKIKLMDYFELVKFKPISSNYEPKTIDKKILKYPLIGARKINNGIVKYIDKYDIDTNGEIYLTICKQGDGGAGYCFIHNGKFSLCSSVNLLRLKEEYKNKIDLNENIKSISLQISNMGFKFNNSLTIQKLNEIEIYIKFNK